MKLWKKQLVEAKRERMAQRAKEAMGNFKKGIVKKGTAETYARIWKVINKVIWDEGFKKSYKKKLKNNERLKDKFWEAMGSFSENPSDPQLRTHKLTGPLTGFGNPPKNQGITRV